MDKIKWAKYHSTKALKSKIKSNMFRTSLAVQSAFQCRGTGSILGQGFKIPHASKKQNLKQKQYCNKFNKDFKKKKINK